MIAIDLGSNTIRFIEYDGIQWGKSFEKIVRTAESLHDTGLIGENAINRVIEAINESKTKMDYTNQAIFACTTAAVRMAKNGEEVLEFIRRKTGVSFKVIDGRYEGELTLRAVQNRLAILGINNHRFILSDIGGGSTEVVVVDGQNTHFISIPVGIVTMAEKSEQHGNLNELLNDFKSQIQVYISSLLLSEKIELLVLTAGTPTTIAAYIKGMDYDSYNPEVINGTRLTYDDCIRTYNDLLAMDDHVRSRYVGVGREVLISTGIRIVETLFNALSLDDAIVIDDGLREGIALEYYRG